MIKTYYLIRHGETFATKKYKGFYGWKVLSAEILPETIPMLERVGTYMKNIPTDANYSSTIKRCVQTSKILTSTSNKEFIYDKRLNEYFFETFGHFKKRVQKFLQELNESNTETVFICTHGAVIAAIEHLVTVQQFTVPMVFNYPPPGILTIIKGKEIEKINFNK